jgi:hypothetical protein
MTVEEIFEAIDSGLAEVSRRLASGELDQSGRFFTDAELAEQAATGEWGKIARGQDSTTRPNHASR